ncbi:MAG: GAF domain-containing protein [Candidatus Riflebacteria bacterium]|nr:GAF domain-containing protein [Candidatus Riflebacteria bacterium]
MPQIEIPDLEQFAQTGVLRRFLDENANAELLAAMLVLMAMTVLTVVFGDPLTPFYSFNFIFGIAAVFFFGITFSPGLGLTVAAGLLTMMGCNAWAAGPAALTIFAVECPFLALFFAGLAVLPGLMPVILEAELSAVEAQNRSTEGKLAELEAQLTAFQKEVRVDRMDRHKKETVKYTSRTTVLNGFVRELLQSSSQREILNVLFHNITRVFGVQECVMLVHNKMSQELLVTRIAHPNHTDFDNKKMDPNHPMFRMVFDRKEPILFDAPSQIEEKLVVSLLFPVLVDGEVYAVFGVGKTKNGDLEKEESDFVLSMAAMASGAIEQLKSILAT